MMVRLKFTACLNVTPSVRAFTLGDSGCLNSAS